MRLVPRDDAAARAGPSAPTKSRCPRFHYQRGAVSRVEACCVCHSGHGIWGTVSAKQRDVEEHRDPELAKGMVDREIGCTGNCHPAAHPDGALSGKAWVPAPKAAEDAKEAE